MSTITLTGNYGFVPDRLSGLAAGTIVDASSASFIQDNWAGDGGANNPYPFQVVQTSGALIIGGTIIGQIDQKADWRTVYDHGNSAGVRIEDAPNSIIRDWRISNTWDAIRVSWNSQNFLIEDVWVTNARDDAVENDRLQSGTIQDSLFDGVFGGVSIDPSSSSPVDGHNETVTLDGVLMRLQPSLYEGELTHASFIKTDSATNGTVTPNLRFINNVIAIEDVTHHSYRSMLDAWANTIESRGNYYLNLSDTPLPANYPMPPAGWTVLQGQAARDYWQMARADWIDRHSGGTAVITGTNNSETITGNSLDNTIDAKGGNDIINGALGTDTMIGGDGNDTYYANVSLDIARETNAVVASGGNDLVYFTGTSGTYTLGLHVERLVLGGVSAINGTGNALGNAISGNSAANTLSGLGGNDVLNGGLGVDTMIGGDGSDAYYANVYNDVVTEANSSLTTGGNDLVCFTGTSGTYTLGLNVERLVLSGVAAINGTGNALANVIVGNDAANKLSGLGGNDIIRGGLGLDFLTGGSGNDYFVFNTAPTGASNWDTISDFNAVTDTIQLENSIYTALGTGPALAVGAFNTGSAATQADDHIIYNTATGALLYDADGVGGGAGIHFATLAGAPVITAADFVLI